MSDYDPFNDPRFVPSTREMPADERAAVEEAIAVLEANIELFDSAILLFQHPGWDVVVQMFDRTAEEIDAKLSREQDQGSWKFYRGQLAQVHWFQSLPTDMAERARRLRRDHAELLRELGRE